MGLGRIGNRSRHIFFAEGKKDMLAEQGLLPPRSPSPFLMIPVGKHPVEFCPVETQPTKDLFVMTLLAKYNCATQI